MKLLELEDVTQVDLRLQKKKKKRTAIYKSLVLFTCCFLFLTVAIASHGLMSHRTQQSKNINNNDKKNNKTNRLASRKNCEEQQNELNLLPCG